MVEGSLYLASNSVISFSILFLLFLAESFLLFRIFIYNSILFIESFILSKSLTRYVLITLSLISSLLEY